MRRWKAIAMGLIVPALSRGQTARTFTAIALRLAGRIETASQHSGRQRTLGGCSKLPKRKTPAE